MAASPRFPWIVALTLITVLGCSPSAFDGLSGRTRDAGHDDAEIDSDSEDAASDEPDDSPDGAQDAGTNALDGSSDGGAQDAMQPGPNTGAADAGDPDASPCVSMSRPLPARPKVTELARMAIPSVFTSRVLGPSQRIGAGRAWILLSNQRASDVPQPATAPANHPLVAYDGPDEPWKGDGATVAIWRLGEQSTSSMAGQVMLPLRGEELPAEHSLWPLSLITRTDGGTGTLAYVLQSRASTATAVWLATIEQGSYTGMRAEKALFTEPPFFVHGARRDGDFVILYACSDPGGAATNSCVVGRVPEAQVDDRSAYRVGVRAGNGPVTWSSDLTAGTPVLENVHTQLSVTYNDHLRAHLAIYGEKNANHAVLRTATVPQGPWSAPVRVPLPPPLVGHNQHIREHASIVQRCESRVLVSYFSPTRLQSDGTPTAGDVMLAAIDLE